MDFIDRILYGGPTGPTPSLPVSGQVKVYIIDVGQGESILVTTDQSSLLIDAGENDKGDEVLEFLDQLGLEKLDYVIATHPDADHIGGMDTVLQNIEVTDGVFFGYLDFGETSFLFNGDQEKEMEKLLLQSGADLDCDMMTMGHHGSSTSSTREYLDAVTPEYASISCGKGNKYNHPHKETIQKLEQMDVEYYRTDLSGNITFTSDGSSISVRTEKP